MDIQAQVTREIEEIHVAFTEWFSARTPADDATFERLVASRFEPGFTIVPPDGRAVAEEELLDGLRGAHGADAGLSIQIREVRVRHDLGDLVIATYEEWQSSDRPGRPPLTGRTSTAVLRRRVEGWGWVHVHETWLPTTELSGRPFEQGSVG
ncbi:nuclear transport factor 2 family protein [Engelhardtia mirabilis]|uniref:SnoaL-like domain-containing protein n=1 Tax=Engelhardtia mirabilis TaxID=2528011 RepID=A0A518BQ66_9BACT|nr:hypothetical protein Pla133_42280 [Planctomycetes bacterium Pla133]QDV03439.1 hypothetical protein Pla86_42270 [Planctomycetes bacterium Pla86]